MLAGSSQGAHNVSQMENMGGGLTWGGPTETPPCSYLRAAAAMRQEGAVGERWAREPEWMPTHKQRCFSENAILRWQVAEKARDSHPSALKCWVRARTQCNQSRWVTRVRGSIWAIYLRGTPLAEHHAQAPCLRDPVLRHPLAFAVATKPMHRSPPFTVGAKSMSQGKNVFCFFFWSHHIACGILVSQSGIKHESPATESQS